MSCHLCEKPSEFQCILCGQPTCSNDVRVRTVCTHCLIPKPCKFTLHQAYCSDVPIIEELVLRFWGDPIQLMFDRTYTISEVPAIVAKSEDKIVGFLSFNEFNQNAILIVALAVLPQYHGCGIGQALIRHIEDYAKNQKKQQLLVVTSNDNLPALAFYQRLGFQLFEVVPDVIAKKLGGLQRGIANIPIRDELRLRKIITR